jgi:hypothetical protein
VHIGATVVPSHLGIVSATVVIVADVKRHVQVADQMSECSTA